MAGLSSGAESNRTQITICTLLGGFSFSAILALMRMQSASPTVRFRVALIALLAATFLFLITLVGSWCALEWSLFNDNEEYERMLFYKATVPCFAGAFVAFAVGVSATAFLHSVLAGTVAVVGSVSLIAYFCLISVEYVTARKQKTATSPEKSVVVPTHSTDSA
jgi:hypothetical protein